MRADYLRPWMDLLLARVEPGERILAQGRAFEPHRDDFELTQLISGPGCAVVVTERRVLWVSRGDQRWARTVPFAVVRSYVELTQAHRYALALDHEGLERLRWVPAHRFLFWSWGDAEEAGPVSGSVLGFSRRDAAAARAIRMQLQAAGVPAGEPRSLPKRERRREVPSGFLRPGRVRGTLTFDAPGRAAAPAQPLARASSRSRSRSGRWVSRAAMRASRPTR